MKVLLYPTVHGILFLNEEDNLLEILWGHISTADLAEKYLSLIKGNIPSDFIEIINKINQENNIQLLLENPYIAQSLNVKNNYQTTVIDDNQRLKKIQENEIQYWIDGGVQLQVSELTQRTKILSEYLIKAQISETSTQKDALVKQAIDTIVDIDKSTNIFITRLREWYGLHFPELTDKLIPNNHQFCEFVAKIGSREQLTKEKLQSNLNYSDKKADFIFEKANRSMGGMLEKEDLYSIQKLAEKILDQYSYRDYLENYIDKTTEIITPNLKAVLGSNITAKFISLAGSLEKLAMLPSSTIQVLGAEKALFKALRSHSDTPKYGILFQWNKIRGEKSHLRGKISRMVAGKISILAKVDYYKGNFIGDKINTKIDQKIKLVRKQFPKPPKKKISRKSKRKFDSKPPHRHKKSRSFKPKPPRRKK